MAGLLSAGCLATLVVSAWMRPDPAGHGTHTQLGLDGCAWATHFEAPCATCGMTTSFAHAADGAWLASVSAQPFGALMALLAALLFWGGAHVAVTGSRLGAAAAVALNTRLLIAGGALFLLAWLYKWATW